MAEKLKRCPFCNSEARVMSEFGDVWLVCKNCGAGTGVFDTKEEAVNAWNSRPIEYELARLREVLAFYADSKKYKVEREKHGNVTIVELGDVIRDKGWYARKVLKGGEL